MTDDQDGTYEACLAYLNSKGHVLWGDFMLSPESDRNIKAAHWLDMQIRGVEAHATPSNKPVNKPSNRPSALITHGQQAETW